MCKGYPRIINAAVDIGAYEMFLAPVGPLQLSSTPAAVSVCDGAGAGYTVASVGSANFIWEYFDGASWQPFSATEGSVTGDRLMGATPSPPTPILDPDAGADDRGHGRLSIPLFHAGFWLRRRAARFGG